LAEKGIITESELDSRALNALKEFDTTHISTVLNEVRTIYDMVATLTSYCLYVVEL